MWVLGKQIETHISKTRFLILIVIIGIFSNICQYLMNGPYFLGLSGVILGMAGFIWMRQKIAPWEGYTLPKTTLLFLLIFVLGMIGLQVISFVMEISGKNFVFNIANTAHVAGALMGMGLGRLSFFSWRNT
jgi:GlpG protein